MKTKTFIVYIFFAVSSVFSQQWGNYYDFPGTNLNITQLQFLNTNTGWVTTKAGNTLKIWKTNNKGVNWSDVKTFNQYSFVGSASSYLTFINENTGYFAYVPTDRGYTVIEKTTDGGNSWNRKVDYNIVPLSEHPLILFKNDNEGYLFANNENVPADVKVYRTYDGFENWSQIHLESPPYFYSFHINDIIKDNNNNYVITGWNRHGSSYNFSDAFRIDYYNNAFSRAYGTENTQLKYLYASFINSQAKYLGVQSDNSSSYPGTRFYIDFGNQTTSIQIDPQFSLDKVGGMTFSNDSKGFVSVGNKVYITNNSGLNWTNEGNLASDVYSYQGHHLIKSFGDVCYAGSGSGKFNTRLLQGNYNTNYDWSSSSSGSIAVDGQNIGTPSTGYFRGGSTNLYALPYIVNGSDTTARFYYWGGNCNTSMNYSAGSYLINSGSNINADYKTLLKTTTSGALYNANQVKAIKDTNGVTNLIYESMGGIFYTRTKPDGTFKAEEVLSSSAYNPLQGYATFNNKNPYLCEVKNTNNTETNMWACWERREGNNIKIMVSARIYSENIPPNWPKHSWGSAELLTLSGVPEGFECFPKIFLFNSSGEFKVITYLRPENNLKKLVARLYFNNNFINEYELIATSDIQEYAIASIPNIYGWEQFFNLNIAYRVGQSISYKRIEIGKHLGYNTYFANTIADEPNISLDNSRWRASLDISLKNTANSTSTFNMQPVITYQGRYDVRVMIENEDGPPIEQAGAYYPIYVKERLSGGSWSSSNISYNSPVNTVQMTPNIEGSKQMNSCILDYARGSSAPYTFNKVVPRWSGVLNSGYGCSPTAYSGTDAKFIKGSLINNSSTSHKLMTLSLPNNTVYTVGTQNFTITNGIEGDGNFDAISGSVEDNEVKYTFNLGNILVNSSNIGFLPDIDTAIDNSGELNSNMVSETFNLNENDTLIIGRNATYVLNDPNGAPAELEYWVKLMNKSTNSMHRLLAHDTIHTADSVIYEFLEGYIIRNIPNGSDSFYVQLEIDTVDGNFGIGGGLGGDGDGGDNIQLKRKIYWENEKLSGIVNNIPKEFNLYQNFPNPFNPATVIKYDLPKDVKVIVKIYDLLGREVTTLVNNEFKNAGRYELNWNAGNYASGVYIYRIEAGDFVSTKKMILVK